MAVGSLHANYLHRDPALGESAIRKLEGKQTNLPTARPTEQRQYD
jgi:hypothetical protein